MKRDYLFFEEADVVVLGVKGCCVSWIVGDVLVVGFWGDFLHGG